MTLITTVNNTTFSGEPRQDWSNNSSIHALQQNISRVSIYTHIHTAVLCYALYTVSWSVDDSVTGQITLSPPSPWGSSVRIKSPPLYSRLRTGFSPAWNLITHVWQHNNDEFCLKNIFPHAESYSWPTQIYLLFFWASVWCNQDKQLIPAPASASYSSYNQLRAWWRYSHFIPLQ